MFITFKHRSLRPASIAAGMTLACLGMAVPLAPGATVGTPGTTVAIHPNLAGTVIADTLRPFSMVVNGTTYTGEVQDRVVREFATGTLDFYYRIMLDKGALQGDQLIVARTSYPMSASGAGITTDVDWRIDGLGISGPVLANRTPDGTEVKFLYKGYFVGTGSAQSTRFTYISTNAKSFKLGGIIAFRFQGGTTVVMHGYQPA